MANSSGTDSEGRAEETWAREENSRRIWGEAYSIFKEKRGRKEKAWGAIT